MAFLAGTAARTAGGAVAKQGAGKAAGGAVAKQGAGKAAGGKAAARRAPAGGPSKLERDRAAIQDIKDARPDPAMKVQPDDDPNFAAPAPTSSGAGAAAPSWSLSDLKPANAGGGLVLGTFAYVLGLTYLRSGRAGVKAWLKAKFLNDTSGG